MSLITIRESDMTFGSYAEEDLFHIEESNVCKRLNIPTVEFVTRYRNGEILMVEAKNSSPRPGNQEDFAEFIAEITGKFTHTMNLYFALVLKRLDDPLGDMHESFKTADYAITEITLLLVINGHKVSWLPPIKNALTSKLKRLMKTWRLKIAVMNHEQALSYGIVKE